MDPDQPAGGPPNLMPAPGCMPGTGYGGAPCQPVEQSGFRFGSYGRIVASSDGRGGRGREADIVAYGSRIDEGSYSELELTRFDYWDGGVKTRIVSTLAIGEPFFHESGQFDATLALRNLFVEESGIFHEDLAIWAGSRMYRGDDIYLLNVWPLDNLNTLGGGVRFNFWEDRAYVAWHLGMNRIDSPFQAQDVPRVAPQNQPGVQIVPLLNRPRVISSFKLASTFPVIGDKGGLKGVLYGEVHRLPSGEREEEPGVVEDLPGDSGYVIGAQFGIYKGERDTFVNLFARHATDLAAYGEFGTPLPQNDLRTAEGASETLLGMAANVEYGPVAVLAGAYFRSFRSASPEKFDFDNLDEGIFIVRPQVYFTDHFGLGVEGSVQSQERAVLDVNTLDPLKPSAFKFGVMPFLSPSGRGSFKRPHIRLIWAMTQRNDAARSLYPNDDVFSRRKTEQFFGIGAEWWFNSTSYGF